MRQSSKGHSIYRFGRSNIFFDLDGNFHHGKICISLWCKQAVEPTGEREITERKKKKKVTLCVLAVVVTFIVCWIPAAVLATSQLIQGTLLHLTN